MKWMRKLKDESGQAMILTLLCMTCLLGFVGFAADVGTLLRAKRMLQTAADSAAIAATMEQPYGGMQTAANAAAAQNGVTVGVNGGTVIVSTPPTEGAYAGQAGYVEAIVAQDQPIFFLKILNIASQTVSARAVAANGPGSGCIYTLGPTGTGVGVTGNANLSMPNCGIVVDSTSNCAISVNGNISLTAQSIGVAGTACQTGNVHVNPTPVQHIAPAADPLGYLTPPSYSPGSCQGDPHPTGNVVPTISPGCYNGLTVTGNSAINLNPGTYIINGNLTILGNASITGTGVTLDLLGSTSLGGNIAMNLTAPTSGTYNGILIFQPASNTNPLSLTGNSSSTLHGVIYAPGAAVTFNGNSGSNIYTDFVSKSLTLTGNVGFNDYAALPGSDSPLTSIRLVE